MGKLPKYFDYFRDSCLRNPNIDFIVFNDAVSQDIQNKNLLIKKLSLDEYNKLCSDKLGFNILVDAKNGFKVSDYKPAYRIIFSEYLEKYDFWGWCDLDLIWGNMSNFLTPDVLNTYDVITSKEKWTGGHFTMFRNTELNAKLYEFCPTYQQMFEDTTYNYFIEESCRRWQGKFYTIQELTEQNLHVSIYDVVRNLEKEGKIKPYFKMMVREHPMKPDNYHYEYRNGSFYDIDDKQEFMYFHLITVKKIWRFYIPNWQVLPNHFHVVPMGMYKDEEKSGVNKLIWFFKRLNSALGTVLKNAKKLSFWQIIGKISKEITKKE
jgi:hypothetical protein